MSELKQQQQKHRIKEKKVLGRNEVLDGTLEELLSGELWLFLSVFIAGHH